MSFILIKEVEPCIKNTRRQKKKNRNEYKRSHRTGLGTGVSE